MSDLRLERRLHVVDVFVDDVPVSDEGLAPDARELLDELRRREGRARLRVCSCGEPGCWSHAGRGRHEDNAVVQDDWVDGVDDGGWPSDPVARGPVRFPPDRYHAALDALERSL